MVCTRGQVRVFSKTFKKLATLLLNRRIFFSENPSVVKDHYYFKKFRHAKFFNVLSLEFSLINAPTGRSAA